MKAYTVIQSVAIAALIASTAMLTLGAAGAHRGTLRELIETLLGSILGGIFFVWMIWERPRQWGLWTGLFVSAILCAQTFTWLIGASGPFSGENRNVLGYAVFEAVLVIAAGCCLALRWCYPKGP